MAASEPLATPSPAAISSVELQRMASGVGAIGAIANAGGASLYLALLDGRILVWDGSRVLQRPFLDLSSKISTGGERGLLGLAFHPRFAENGFLFVNYTNRDGDTEVVRYRRQGSDSTLGDPGSARLLLRIAQPFSNHNGGQIAFGPDGYLYVGMGDGGGGGDPQCNGQRDDTLLGKLLRLDVDGSGSGPSGAYGIPADNPYRGGGDPPDEVWAEGLRNPWRFAFDRGTGDLWLADVGQGAREEVDRQPAGSHGGENYGWNSMEGRACYASSCGGPACNDSRLTLPVIDYDHTGGRCAVVGGTVYRGSRAPALAGRYVYGDFCSGELWAASGSGSSWQPTLLPVRANGLTTFGEDGAGELYLGTIGGDLYRLKSAVDQPAGGADLPAFHEPSRRRFSVPRDAALAGFSRFRFGTAGNQPLAGDWDGDGSAGIGVYDAARGTFALRDRASAGAADHSFRFGSRNGRSLAIAGDWDGDGVDTIGLYDPATGVFRLKDSHRGGSSDHLFAFGSGGGLPVAGDWDGDGRDGVGLFYPASGRFELRDDLTAGAADHSFVFAPTSGALLPLAGDWNGDGRDGVGVYRRVANAGGELFLRNQLSAGAPDAQLTPALGLVGAVPLAGRWDLR